VDKNKTIAEWKSDTGYSQATCYISALSFLTALSCPLTALFTSALKKTAVIRLILYFCGLIKTRRKLKTNTTYNFQDTAAAGGAFLCAAAPRRRPVF
jgi:hypothetical protein